MKTAISTAVFALALASGPASATVVTFGTTAAGTTARHSEAGYDVSAGSDAETLFIGGSSKCASTCADNGTRWAMVYPGANLATTLVVRANDHSLFNLLSFDAAEGFANPEAGGIRTGWAAQILVTGVLEDNSLVTEVVMLDQVNDGMGGAVDFQTFASSFTGAFKELRFTGFGGNAANNFILDNLSLQPATLGIPEPGSLALFGAALLAAAAAGRRTTKAGPHATALKSGIER